MTNLKKRVKDYTRYPEELKRKIAKEYLSGAASYAILAEENGLRNKGVVREFVKWYKRGLSADENTIISMDAKKQDDKSPLLDAEKSTEDLKQELIELRKKLERSELKVEMLETMIDEAESELTIDIRKKSGTNQ